MLAVAAIYPGEVDKRHCGVACKESLCILPSKLHKMEGRIWQNALKLWKKPC